MKCVLEEQLKRIEEILHEIRKICKECDEAQREYERTLKAMAMAGEEAQYWKSKYYKVADR